MKLYILKHVENIKDITNKVLFLIKMLYDLKDDLATLFEKLRADLVEHSFNPSDHDHCLRIYEKGHYLHYICRLRTER